MYSFAFSFIYCTFYVCFFNCCIIFEWFFIKSPWLNFKRSSHGEIQASMQSAFIFLCMKKFARGQKLSLERKNSKILKIFEKRTLASSSATLLKKQSFYHFIHEISISSLFKTSISWKLTQDISITLQGGRPTSRSIKKGNLWKNIMKKKNLEKNNIIKIVKKMILSSK